MKRSALASAVLWAAVGFVATGAVVFPPSLQADDAPARKAAEPTISTASYSIALQPNLETGNPQLIVTNLTDQSLRVEWSQRLQSTGKISAMSRMMPAMKDVSTESRAVELPPKGSATVAVLAAPVEPVDSTKQLKEFENRQVLVEAAGQTLRVAVVPPPVPAK